jgi:16S rRNA (guanine966-N2)-methyltransferase
VRQALFDMLMHAPWGGREVLDGAVVLDVFAGTGALGLEALSRGAGSAWFIENDPAALKALQANVLACGAGGRVRIIAGDVLSVAPVLASDRRTAASQYAGQRVQAGLIFLDPPYGQDLVPRAIRALRQGRAIASGALIVAEVGRDEVWEPEEELLADRRHSAARIVVLRSD